MSRFFASLVLLFNMLTACGAGHEVETGLKKSGKMRPKKVFWKCLTLETRK